MYFSVFLVKVGDRLVGKIKQRTVKRPCPWRVVCCGVMKDAALLTFNQLITWRAGNGTIAYGQR